MTKRSRFSGEDRAQHIKLWRQSGVSRAQYCREADIAYYSLSDWLRSEKRRGQQQQRREQSGVGKKATAPAAGFVRIPVSVATRRPPADPVLRVDGIGTLSICMYAGCDVALFQQVLKAVGTC